MGHVARALSASASYVRVVCAAGAVKLHAGYASSAIAVLLPSVWGPRVRVRRHLKYWEVGRECWYLNALDPAFSAPDTVRSVVLK